MLTKTKPEKAQALNIKYMFCNIRLLPIKSTEETKSNKTESITVMTILPKTF